MSFSNVYRQLLWILKVNLLLMCDYFDFLSVLYDMYDILGYGFRRAEKMKTINLYKEVNSFIYDMVLSVFFCI